MQTGEGIKKKREKPVQQFCRRALHVRILQTFLVNKFKKDTLYSGDTEREFQGRDKGSRMRRDTVVSPEGTLSCCTAERACLRLWWGGRDKKKWKKEERQIERERESIKAKNGFSASQSTSATTTTAAILVVCNCRRYMKG